MDGRCHPTTPSEEKTHLVVVGGGGGHSDCVCRAALSLWRFGAATPAFGSRQADLSLRLPLSSSHSLTTYCVTLFLHLHPLTLLRRGQHLWCFLPPATSFLIAQFRSIGRFSDCRWGLTYDIILSCWTQARHHLTSDFFSLPGLGTGGRLFYFGRYGSCRHSSPRTTSSRLNHLFTATGGQTTRP